MHRWEVRFREIATLWCAQDWRGWAATAAADYRFDPGAGAVRTLDQTLEWSQAALEAFPDFSQEVVDVIVGERSVTGIIASTGTFTGPFRVGSRLLEPTGQGFSLPYVKVLELDHEGRVRRDRQFMDYARMTRPRRQESRS